MIFSNKIYFCWFPSPPYPPPPCPDTSPHSVAFLLSHDWVCPIALSNLQTCAPLLKDTFLVPIHKQASEVHRQISKEEMQLDNKHF